MTYYIEYDQKGSKGWGGEGNTKRLKLYFDSVPDVFHAIDREGWKPQKHKASDDRDRSVFQVFNSLAEANDVFLHHPETIRNFSINDEKLVSKEAPGKDIQYDVVGDYVDIDRYLEGVPEHFGEMIMGNPRTVFATINICAAAVWSTTPKYMMEKQKRVMRLVDWLEAQNIRTQIVLSEDSTVIHYEVIVKQFHDPFDLNHLAVAMHPDFFRRTLFLLMEQSPSWVSGYGTAVEYDEKMMKYRSNPEDGLYIYVGGYIHYGNSWNGDDGLAKLNRDFDNVEDKIQRMIDLEQTFYDGQLATGGSAVEHLLEQIDANMEELIR